MVVTIQMRPERIRKTNLTLQQLAINSNAHYFRSECILLHFEDSPVRLTDGQIRSPGLSGGVENQPSFTK